MINVPKIRFREGVTAHDLKFFSDNSDGGGWTIVRDGDEFILSKRGQEYRTHISGAVWWQQDAPLPAKK